MVDKGSDRLSSLPPELFTKVISGLKMENGKSDFASAANLLQTSRDYRDMAPAIYKQLIMNDSQMLYQNAMDAPLRQSEKAHILSPIMHILPTKQPDLAKFVTSEHDKHRAISALSNSHAIDYVANDRRLFTKENLRPIVDKCISLINGEDLQSYDKPNVVRNLYLLKESWSDQQSRNVAFIKDHDISGFASKMTDLEKRTVWNTPRSDPKKLNPPMFGARKPEYQTFLNEADKLHEMQNSLIKAAQHNRDMEILTAKFSQLNVHSKRVDIYDQRDRSRSSSLGV